VLALLRAGAEVDALSDEEDGWTPLLMAAQSGHGAVVLALLEAGADSETTLDERYTPLVIAAQSGHEAVVLALLRAGADVEGPDASYTPQIAAAEGGHEVLAASLHSWTLALDDPERQYFLRLSNLPTNLPIGDPSACFLAHLPTQVLTTIFDAFSESSSSFASGACCLRYLFLIILCHVEYEAKISIVFVCVCICYLSQLLPAHTSTRGLPIFLCVAVDARVPCTHVF
jgi:hypothetical protein